MQSLRLGHGSERLAVFSGVGSGRSHEFFVVLGVRAKSELAANFDTEKLIAFLKLESAQNLLWEDNSVGGAD
jgi:hypothetical protein